MAKAVHSMVRVLDEARSVDFYRAAFGLAVADRIDFDELHAGLPEERRRPTSRSSSR